jgi:hypothetical protein
MQKEGLETLIKNKVQQKGNKKEVRKGGKSKK